MDCTNNIKTESLINKLEFLENFKNNLKLPDDDAVVICINKRIKELKHILGIN